MNERIYKILEFTEIREQLLTYVSCEIARKTAAELAPSLSMPEIERMLTETDDAVALMMKKGRPPLGGLYDVRLSVRRATSGSALSFTELLRIGAVLKAARRTINYCHEGEKEGGEVNLVAERISTLVEDFRLESDISRCILSEDEMADDASPTLADIRRKIVREQASIKEKLSEFIRSDKYSKAVQDEVITMRGDRYCIPIKAEHRGDFPGMVHDTSGSGQTLFIEPASIVEANNKIRELKVKEKEEIERIVMVLSSLCAEKCGIIEYDDKELSEIDFIFAKAQLALKMNAKKPQLNDRGHIKIVKGRHPLIDPKKIVPTSLYVGYDFRTLVITGPNTGGKTVTLKTVGLFTLMMQSGLLVPCESVSELSVFNDIFADIGDEQSIEQNLSTFSAHMKNIVKIVDKCDDKSLVLFDELGAGTDPTEGAALAMSILECVYQRGSITLATTHYSELKAFTVQTEGFENACCEFDVDTLSPTYRLMIGIPGKSNAFAISTKLGLDGAIVSRAKEFLSGEDVRFEDLLSDIEKKRQEIEQKQAEIVSLQAEADRITKEITAEKDKISDKREELLKKARQEAAKIVTDAKKNVDEMLGELRTLCKDAESDNKERLKMGEAVGRDFAKMKNESDASSAVDISGKKDGKVVSDEEIMPGKDFYCVSIDGNVAVLKKPDASGNVYVKAGIMKMFVPKDDLREIATAPQKNAKNSGKKTGEVKIAALSMKPEIDVRGCMGDEAVLIVDKYLDDAQMAKLETVSIIHGKGTGALRLRIHEMLKKDKRVKEFRLGEFGEGDFGVTIVKVKI